MNALIRILSLASFGLVSMGLTAEEPTAEFYLQKIKPVLKARCFACHGALKQESGLRVDTVEAIREHGVIGSGELLDRLVTDDLDVRMPPEGEALSQQEVDDFRMWLEADAPSPVGETAETDPTEHWAFQRIERPIVPVAGEGNPIDAFIADKWGPVGLRPQPQARRSLLLRRLYLDVIGLPPSLEQLNSDDSMATTIDRLLANPQYGERWGRHWMDVWRYSDWYGLGNELRNSQKHLWHWRDWIVDSLNDDKGYDQMIVEMLAADEVAPDDSNAIAATGFLARNYYLFNRTTWLDSAIEHTGKALLGLTMNCAKCHDHKYDPISQEDYYRFRAIFEPHHVRLDPIAGQTDFDQDGLPRVYDDRPDLPTFVHLRGNPAEPLKNKLIQPGPPVFLASFSADPQSVELPVEAWAPGVREYVQKDQLEQLKRKCVVAREQVELAHRRQGVEAKRMRVTEITLADDFDRPRPNIWETVGLGWIYSKGAVSQTMPTQSQSCLRSKKSHPASFELRLRLRITGGPKWRSAGVRFGVDPSGENSHTVYLSAHEGGPKVQLSRQVDGGSLYPPNAKADRPVRLNQTYELLVQVQDTLVNVSLDGEYLFAYRLPTTQQGRIELFAFDSTADFDSISLQPLTHEVLLKTIGLDSKAPTDGQTVPLAEAKLKVAQAELIALRARIAADNAVFRGAGEADTLLKTAESEHRLLSLAQAELNLLTCDAGQREEMEQRLAKAKTAVESKVTDDTVIHRPIRGSQRALDQKTHKFSQYSATYPRTSTGRRTALARWITHRDNPLTARVAVNHIWLRHFGKPLVDNVFDWGRRSSRPIHQDLLDFLAIELIDSNWSMKHIHRMILSSQAWQRTSSNLGADPLTLAEDPANQYYWRMNSRRMESQVVRDSLLELSGQLDPTMRGPSLNPGPQVRRRSLYLIHALERRDPFLSMFDDADVLACYRRNESIVPQQALALMNSRDAIEAAERIALRFSKTLPDADFVNDLFQEVLGRLPSEPERQAAIAFLREQSDRKFFVHALLNHNDFLVIR